jgi:hypothetical protein
MAAYAGVYQASVAKASRDNPEWLLHGVASTEAASHFPFVPL